MTGVFWVGHKWTTFPTMPFGRDEQTGRSFRVFFFDSPYFLFTIFIYLFDRREQGRSAMSSGDARAALGQ